MPSDDFWEDWPSAKKGKISSPPLKKTRMLFDDNSDEEKSDKDTDVQELQKNENGQSKEKAPDTIDSKENSESESKTDSTDEDKSNNRKKVKQAKRFSIPKFKVNLNIPKIGKGLGIALGIILGLFGGLSLAIYQLLDFRPQSTETTPYIMDIQKGESSMAVANELEQNGIIVSRWPFLVLIHLKSYKIQAGTYTLSTNATTREIIKQITEGNVSSKQVTIPEGWRAEQIGALLEKMNIITKDDFVKATKYDPIRYTLPTGITLNSGASMEGLFFPDTYTFKYGITGREIVAMMLDNFSRRTAELKPTYAQIILASIVEREAKFDADRSKIAGVYQNRLKNNMKLEADPTVQYAKDTNTNPTKYWQALASGETQTVSSPYNTYTQQGLPPTPIANPGLKSIRAAVNPEQSEYYFFISNSDGTIVYSKTLDEHNRAIKNIY